MKTVGALILAVSTLTLGASVPHANTFGTLATSVILQRALELTFTMRPELSALTLDLSDRRCKLNQQIISRIHSIPTVQAFPGATEDANDVDVPVTLSSPLEVRRTFTAAQVSSTDRNLVDEAAQPMATAIANYIVDQVALLWTVGNFNNGSGTNYNTVVPTANVDYSTIANARATLNKRGVPQGTRFGVFNTDAYTYLLEDPQVARYQKVILDDEEDPVQTGMIGRVSGFNNIFEYPSLPTTGNMIGFFGTKDSTVIASGILADPRDVLPGAPFPGRIDVITEPKTKFSVIAVEYIDPSTLNASVYMTWLMGTAKGNPNNGQLITSA